MDLSYSEYIYEAENSDLICKVLKEYYGSKLVRVSIDDLTESQLFLSQENYNIGKNKHPEITHTKIKEVNFDKSNIDSYFELVASKQQTPVEKIRERVFNGDALHIRGIQQAPIKIKTGETDYYSKIESDYLLQSEILSAAFRWGLEPDANQDEIINFVKNNTFKYRDEYGPDADTTLKKLQDRAAPFGNSCMIILKDKNAYKVLLGKRRQNTTTYPNKWSLLPSGGLELLSDGNINKNNVIAEFIEEVLHSDEEADFSAKKGKFEENYEEYIDIHFLGTLISADRLGVDLLNLIVIREDVEEIKRRASVGSNTEFEIIKTLNVEDSRVLKDVFSDREFTPDTKIMFAIGLNRLQEMYDYTTPIDIKIE
jgi:hypothetical protein